MQLTARRALCVVALAAGCAGAPATPDNSACKAPSCAPAQDSYAAEVMSIGTGGPPNLEFADLILDQASGYFVMTMPPPALVTGSVLAEGKPVPATVVFTRPSRIPGRPDVLYQSTVDGTGAYTISVPPNIGGEQYLVRVQPTDTSHYPPRATTLKVSGDTQLDLSLASGAELALLRGSLKDVVHGPIDGARVVLRDAVSLLDVSTTGVTASDGTFLLTTPLDATALSSALVLLIERGDDLTGLLSMTVELGADQVQAELVDAALGLTLPSLPAPSHLKLRVVGSGSGGVDKAIAGAHVLLRSLLLDTGVLGKTRVVHEVEAQTDSDGQFSVDVYSNSAGARAYTLVISPPADSDFQSSSSTITVGASSGVGSTVRLPPRPLVTGRVLDPAGAPLKGAVLQPASDASTDATQATSLATTAKAATATTDIDGRFAFRLDVGSYVLGVLPPATSQLPRRWLPSRTIDSDVDLGDLSTPMAIEFDGVVVGPDAMPLRNLDGTPLPSSVRLYLVPAGNRACDKDLVDCLIPPQLQAEGTTDKDGRTKLLLAAEGT